MIHAAQLALANGELGELGFAVLQVAIAPPQDLQRSVCGHRPAEFGRLKVAPEILFRAGDQGQVRLDEGGALRAGRQVRSSAASAPAGTR